ncbi:MAG: C25 family cysteine peptidase [Bacteroidota bacterium]
MKKFLLLFILSISTMSTFAINYGNEWIDYSQPYFKIKVAQDGIYRIPYSTLNASIPGFSGINGANFTMFHNGENIPIYVSTSGTLGISDYIEFMGRKNNGELETALYDDTMNQMHKLYSLFSDTSAYYLTYNSSSTHPRFISTINDMTSLPPREEYFIYTARKLNTNAFSFGKGYNIGGSTIWDSQFDLAEGYIGSDFVGVTSNNNISTPNVYTTGPSTAQVRSIVFSKSTNNHIIRETFNGTPIVDSTRFGYYLWRFNNDIPISLITTTSNVAITAADPDNDRNAISLIEISYPKTFNFEAQSTYEFTIDAGPRKYIEITNFNNRSTTPVLYDLTNNLRITGVLVGSTLRFSLPASTDARNLYLRSDATVDYKTVNSISTVNFVDLRSLSSQGDYIIISHPSLYNDGSGNNWVEAYRQYRDIGTSTTGAYYARIIDIDQIYEQFGYGVPKSPLAYRNFVSYALDQWTIKPKYLFLVGKGREYNSSRNGGTGFNQNIIPSFGQPASDAMISGLQGNYVQRVSTGRLAAETGLEVKSYLDKVIQYENEQRTFGDPYQTLENKAWMKEVLHLGGGTTLSDQTEFKGYLNSFKSRIERDSFGAHVTSLFKTSTEPIDVTATEFLKSRIDSGISLMTFFGHSASGTFDISIDEPENYHNVGKYPVIYSNGCFAGDLFNSTKGISERFVLESQKGAIAFIASTGLSLSNTLFSFGSEFYKAVSGNQYGKSIGDDLKSTVAKMKATSYIFNDMISHEVTLHGDPALKFNNYNAPDYMISPQTVYFDPPVITASIDTFELNIVTTNLGMAIVDSYAVDVTRILSDGSQYLYREIVKAPFYRDTVVFRIPTLVSGGGGLGINNFNVFVDADNEIDNELSETNNYIINSVSTTIQSEDILPIYPYEFSIVPKQPIPFKASTVNPFAAARWYVFELDTTELFNSSIKQRLRVYQSGGVVHFNPTMLFQDSIVYYWRVSQDSTAPTSSYSWHNSSFIYIQDEYPGWNQSHYFQWLKDDYSNVYMDNDRTLKFVPDVKSIEVNTGLWNGYGGPTTYERIEWKLNGANMHRARMIGCGATYGINIAVIDPVTGLPWYSTVTTGTNYNPIYGSYHCSYQTDNQFAFTFRTTGTHPTLGIPWSQVISNFIDSIPNGYYILIYSQNNPDYINWDAGLKSKILGLGATQLLDLLNGTANGPYAFFCKKADLSYPMQEQYKTSWSQEVYLAFSITGAWNQGSFTSPKIGPSTEWGSVHWRHNSLDIPNTDNESMDIIGVDAGGYETYLKTLTSTLDTNITFIDARVYPYIKLRYNTDDYTNRTPTQPIYWRVLYKEVPEVALNPSIFYKLTKDTMQQGNILNLQCAVESIVDIDMDSLLVKYDVRDATHSTSVYLNRGDSIQGLDTVNIAFDLNVLGANYIGQNYLVVELNPNNDQIEQYHFNNFGLLKFYVQGDDVNPLLDVTFDGRHILNGDIVSARPNILISLKDDSKFLALDDTSNISISLKYPDGSIRHINYDNDILSFYPADASRLNIENKARVVFKPTLATDGKYELIVTDKDKSGNVSHRNNYRIQFEVINKSTISNVLNYPNPFTTSTRFVFTLTGSDIPTYFKVQIFNATGKVVKEITQDELGPIVIGRNLTQYAWNGTDEFGDALGNGVYFYRIVSTINDEKIEHREESYDNFFKKGFGKMLLIR